LKIGIAHRHDITDRLSWSGIPYYLSRSLSEEGFQIENFSPLQAVVPRGYNWVRRYNWRIFKRWPIAIYEESFLSQIGQQLQRHLRDRPVDLLLSIQEEAIAYCDLPPGLPVIMIHDSTFSGLNEYYSSFSKLTKRSIRLGHQAHQRAIENSTSLVYSSTWAANEAKRCYGARHDRTHVIEFGANLETVPSSEDVSNMIKDRLNCSRISFLFLGVSWDRKGGESAINLISELRSTGVDAVLEVAGCEVPETYRKLDFVITHGFLSKKDTASLDKLERLFHKAHFLLVPSKAECYGCVYCEANAYGLPAIALDTGGVSQIIKPGVNGFLLTAEDNSSENVLRAVIKLLGNAQEYRTIAQHSRTEFEQRLNWGVFTNKLVAVIESTMDLTKQSQGA